MLKKILKLNKLYNNGKYNIKPNLPKYFDKDGFTTLTICCTGGHTRIKDGKIKFPFNRNFAKNHKEIRIKLPPCLLNKKIVEVLIIPKYNARFFVIHYIYEISVFESKKLNTNKALAIDLGVSNFATCVTSDGNSFIIDGKLLKSWNQWYNKRIAELKSIRDHQNCGKKYTNQIVNITVKYNNRTRDFIYKTVKYIIDYCISNNITNIILGYNKTLQKKPNLGKINNQIFSILPLGRFKRNLKYKCIANNIKFITQQESYTSKASFLDNDEIKKDAQFSGRRVKRGLYISRYNHHVNADVNAAYNILRKSNILSFVNEDILFRGALNPPSRIRLFQKQTSCK